MNKIDELKQRRGAVVKEARALLDLVESEKRSLTGEETQTYERMMADVDKLAMDISREEKMQGLEKDLEHRVGNPGKTETTPAADEKTEQRKAAFVKYLRSGMGSLSEVEQRALRTDDDSEGGYLVAPEQFVAQLIKNVDDLVSIRNLATVIPLTSAASLGVPTLDTDLTDADWTTELATGSADDGMRFGKRELRPHPAAKRVKVSAKLLRSGAIDIEALVRARLAYKFAVTQEKAFLTGDGDGKPLGVFTASADGIPTSRDEVGSNTATAIKPDTLVDVKHSLKAPYLLKARWLFHRDVIAHIRKLKDGNGQYLWQPGLSADIPDRILDLPYISSEYAPNTFESAAYVGILGDFSNYWIADALDLQIQRLVELYAETNQIGYIGRFETDGAPVLAEAFTRIKLG